MAKLEEGREPEEDETPAPPPAPESPPERPRSSAQKSVHFDASEPEIIPPREDEGPEPDAVSTHSYDDGEGERAVVLYDFKADGEDEMSVNEGETLLVLERDTDEWWKCRNGHGEEGVVPANYLEVSIPTHVLRRESYIPHQLVPGSGPPVPSVAAEEDARASRAAREAEERTEEERREREEKERKEKERKREAEQRAKASAAAAEADRKRREQEREKQREKEKESERSAAEEARRQKAAQRESSSGSIKDKRPNGESTVFVCAGA